MSASPWVIVVGAGPAGLLLSLLLSQAGIPDRVLDLATKLGEKPRATHYGGKADGSILDTYSDVRRQKYPEFIDPVSSNNIRLMFDANPEIVLERNDFLKLAKRAATDKAFANEMMLGINLIRYDFTQHYHTNSTGPTNEAATNSILSAPVAVGDGGD